MIFAQTPKDSESKIVVKEANPTCIKLKGERDLNTLVRYVIYKNYKKYQQQIRPYTSRDLGNFVQSQLSFYSLTQTQELINKKGAMTVDTILNNQPVHLFSITASNPDEGTLTLSLSETVDTFVCEDNFVPKS